MLNTSKPLNFKLKKFTRVMKKRPDFPQQKQLKELYRYGDLEDRVYATILNGVISNKKPVFLLSRDILEEMLASDPNTSRKRISGQSYREIQKMFDARFTLIAKWVSIPKWTGKLKEDGTPLCDFDNYASVYSLNPDKDIELFEHCLGETWEIEYEFRKRFVLACRGLIKKKPWDDAPISLPNRWNFLAELQELEKKGTLKLRTARSPVRIKSINNIYIINYTPPLGEKNFENLKIKEKNTVKGIGVRGGVENQDSGSLQVGNYSAMTHNSQCTALQASASKNGAQRSFGGLADKVILEAGSWSETLTKAFETNWYLHGGTVEEVRSFKRKGSPAYLYYLLESVNLQLEGLFNGGSRPAPNQSVTLKHPYGEYGFGYDKFAQFINPIAKRYYELFNQRFNAESTEIFYPTTAKHIKNCLEIIAGKKATITQSHIDTFMTAVDYALCNWKILYDNPAFRGKHRTVSAYPNLNNMIAGWRFRIILHNMNQWIASYAMSLKVRGSRSQWLSDMMLREMDKPKHKKDIFFSTARKKRDKFAYLWGAARIYASYGVSCDKNFKGMFKRLKANGIKPNSKIEAEALVSMNGLYSFLQNKNKNGCSHELTQEDVLRQILSGEDLAVRVQERETLEQMRDRENPDDGYVYRGRVKPIGVLAEMLDAIPAKSLKQEEEEMKKMIEDFRKRVI